MNLFIQGMRRSGTTILYDALLEDPALRCFYEPLREESETPGGGSGARHADPFAETRALRMHFRDVRYPSLAIEQFNWGGPREPTLELEPDLPPHCRALMAHLLEQGPQVAIKETRLYCKLGVLAELDRGATFVHVVRDPRAVAASVVLGRRQRHRARLRTADDFFSDRSPRKLWSSREISERLLARPGHERIRDPSNVLRALLVWKVAFDVPWSEGRRLFGDHYLLIKNEDLRADPAAALSRLYALLGRELPPAVADWAAAHVRPTEAPPFADDPRWIEELKRAGLERSLDHAGYSDISTATLGS